MKYTLWKFVQMITTFISCYKSVPMLSVKTIVQKVKSIIAKELFRLQPKVKKQFVGRSILDERKLCKYSRTICK